MKKGVLLFVVLAFLTVNALLFYHFFDRLKIYPLYTKPINVQPLRLYGSYKVLDLDHDGKKELVVGTLFPAIEGKNEISIFNPFSKKYIFDFLGEFLVKTGYYVIGSRIVEVNGEKDIIFKFVGTENGRIYLKDINNRGEIISSIALERTTIEFQKNGGTRFIYSNLIDLNGDKKKELLGVIFTTYLRFPRGMAAYNPDTGKLLWEYYAGSMITREFLIKDIDGDGKKEIIIGTFACNNGAVMNGTDDRHSYVIVLNSDGTERWKRELGGWYTSIFIDVDDLDGDGIQEIVASKEIHRSRDITPGEIWVFNGSTGETKAYFFRNYTSFSRPFIGYYKGEKYIYVADSQSNVWMLDKQMKVFNRIRIKTPGLILNPWEGEEWNYIYVSTVSRLLVFTKDLRRKIFEYRYFHPMEVLKIERNKAIYDFSENGIHKGVLAADVLYAISERKITFLNRMMAIFNSGILFTIIGIFLFNLSLLILLFTLKDARASGVVEENYWWDVIQELVHRIKTPLTTLFWCLERVKNDLKKGKLISPSTVESMIEDLNKLNNGLISLIKMSSINKTKLQEINLTEELNSLMDKFIKVVEDKIEIDFAVEEELIMEADRELLKEAFLNIIENSIEAMPDGGKLTVIAYKKTSPFSSKEEIVVEITDTGHGIKRENLRNIFKPNFSTKKKGMGIGLTISKRIIEAHGGRIEVYSKPGFGTKFTIYLPVNKEK